MIYADIHHNKGILFSTKRLFDLATDSLVKKIIWLTCAAVLLSTCLISTINYFRLETVLVDMATEKLAGQTRLVAQRFMTAYDEMDSDARVLALTPPIQGIIRSTVNAGIDPLDGSSREIWRERLSTIFLSVMTARPHYFQIRFIGLANHGKEIVRVNRVPYGLEVVKPADLQGKADEPYFQNALQMDGSTVHFSEVSYNREHGKIDPAMIPTIRAIIPVFDGDGLFGFVVINADYDAMLSETFKATRPEHDTIVFDINGDHIIYQRDGRLGKFKFQGTGNDNLPDEIKYLLEIEKPERTIHSAETISYSIRQPVFSSNPDAFLGVVLQMSYHELMKPAVRSRNIGIALSAGLVLVCLALSLYLARKFTRPIGNMIAEISRDGDPDRLPDLPLHRNDEFGALARAFHKKASDLIESKVKKRSILDNIVDGVITIDDSGCIEIFNPSCERIFGYTAAEVIGKNVKMLMPPPISAEHDKYVSRYVRTGDRHILGETREESARRKDGSIFTIELSISELLANDRRLFIGSVRDISERKQIEIMKDEFISTVNHEIRTPLTAIQGSLGLLRRTSEDRLDEKGRKLLDLSFRNCEDLTKLINDILDIDKMSAGDVAYAIEDTELFEVVQQTVDARQETAQKQGVTLSVASDVDAVHVRIDSKRFSQALGNLLSNAEKFSPPGEQVGVSLSLTGDRDIRVSVSDRGPGIPQSFHGKLFQKFAQADSSATRAKGGSGLGLSISKAIIESMGGTIEFETEEGKGTTFTIVLPQSPLPGSAGRVAAETTG